MLLWLDLETTGLVPNSGRILEVGVVLTSDQLHELYQQAWVVHNDQASVVTMMDSSVHKMHACNGLLSEVGSDRSVFLSVVEEQLVQLVQKWFTADERPILCGNSIHFDRSWLKVHMPRFESLLHYRMGDASGAHELAKRINNLQLPKAETTHRALADVRGSIQLARQVFAVNQELEGPRKLTIQEMQEQAHRTTKAKGFWEVDRPLTEVDALRLLSQKLALVHSEVSEALEALRQEDQSDNNFGEELADVLIRVGDLAEFAGVDLDAQVSAKLKKNDARPNKHSKRF